MATFTDGRPNWVRWVDPIEGAFALDIPAGWHVEGGTFRPAAEPCAVVRARSGDGVIQIFIGDDQVPRFVEPDGFMADAPPEESACAPGVVVKRFRTGEQYAREYGLNFFGRLSGRSAQLVMSEPDPMAEAQFPLQGFAPGVAVSAGVARFSVFWPIGTGVGMVAATILRSPVQHGPGGMWRVTSLHRISVTEPTVVDRALEVWRLMCRSWAWDPAWTAMPAPHAGAAVSAGSAPGGAPPQKPPAGLVEALTDAPSFYTKISEEAQARRMERFRAMSELQAEIFAISEVVTPPAAPRQAAKKTASEAARGMDAYIKDSTPPAALRSAAQEGLPRLELSESAIDFGVMAQADQPSPLTKTSHSLRARNAGGGELGLRATVDHPSFEVHVHGDLIEVSLQTATRYYGRIDTRVTVSSAGGTVVVPITAVLEPSDAALDRTLNMHKIGKFDVNAENGYKRG
jgi:hypothetical protein